MSSICAIIVVALSKFGDFYFHYSEQFLSEDHLDDSLLVLPAFLILALIVGILSHHLSARALLPFLFGGLLLWFAAEIFAVKYFGVHLFFLSVFAVVFLTFLTFHLRKLWSIDRKLSSRLAKLVSTGAPFDGESADSRIETGLRLLETVLPVSESIVFRLEENKKLLPIGRSRNDASSDSHLVRQEAWRDKVAFCERAINERKTIVDNSEGGKQSAQLAIPLSVNDGWVVGAMFIRLRREFQPEDQSLVESFAHQMARNFQRKEMGIQSKYEKSWWRFFSTHAAGYRLDLATMIDSRFKEYTYGTLAGLHLKESHAIAYLDGTLAYVNQRMRHLSGVDSANIRSLSLFSLLDRFKTEVFNEPSLVIKRVLQTGAPYNCELEFPEKEIVLNLQITLVKAPSEPNSIHDTMTTMLPACFLVSLKDITAEKENEKLRSDMAKLMSHELRTPITSIKGFAELMLTDETVTGDARDFLQIIAKESQRLSKMLTTFLSVSQIQQSDKREFTREPVKIDNVVHEVVDEMQSIANRKKIRLMENPQKNIPPIAGDKGMISKAISQLIDNAIRYSPERTQVMISTLLESEFLRLDVEDRGYGIHPSEHDKVWQKFYRVTRDGQDKEEDSTGLGLALVKEIVEQHGGNVSVESEIGHGSKFTIRLPRL